jgi:hypothetical protein
MSISCCVVIQHWSTSTNMYEPFEWPWINHYQNHQNDTLATNNSSTTINQPFSTFLNLSQPFSTFLNLSQPFQSISTFASFSTPAVVFFSAARRGSTRRRTPIRSKPRRVMPRKCDGWVTGVSWSEQSWNILDQLGLLSYILYYLIII